MRPMLTRTATVLSTTLLLAVAGIGAAGGASAKSEVPTPTPNGRTYVALGDSYSSGESVTPYGWNSDTATNQCHRSQLSYPALVSKRAGINSFGFAACSGALTSDLYSPNHSGYRTPDGTPEPAQLDHVGRNTRLVTITIGGNDLGFSQILGACLYDDQQRATRTDCSAGPVTALVDARLAALAGAQNGATTPAGQTITPLAQVVRDIRAKAPNAVITIGTYPQLVSAGFTGTECRVGALEVAEAPGRQVPLYVSKTDATWISSAIDRLDAVIKAADEAGGPNVLTAEARTTFAGHAHCDTGTPWITPVTGTVSAQSGAVDIDAESMHPTAAGQEAYFQAFASAR